MEKNTNRELENIISADSSVNVSEIMESVRKTIESKKKAGVLKEREIEEIAEMELLPLPDFLEIPNVYEQHLYTEHKIEPMVPVTFTPEQENGFIKKIMAKIRSIMDPVTRFVLRPYLISLKNYIVELHNTNAKDVHDLKPIAPITIQSKEYVKLLHNTANNTIVELSKLKIEEELLKTRIKVMEDKIQFLEERERAVENKLYNEK